MQFPDDKVLLKYFFKGCFIKNEIKIGCHVILVDNKFKAFP